MSTTPLPPDDDVTGLPALRSWRAVYAFVATVFGYIVVVGFVWGIANLIHDAFTDGRPPDYAFAAQCGQAVVFGVVGFGLLWIGRRLRRARIPRLD